jgi:hypothetical protein
MGQDVRFVWRSFRLSFVGDWRYRLWMVVLTVVALLGLNAQAKQFVHGLSETGMTDQVSWACTSPTSRSSWGWPPPP